MEERAQSRGGQNFGTGPPGEGVLPSPEMEMAMGGSGLGWGDDPRSVVGDKSGLRCLFEVPGILTSELGSQVGHFYLCSFYLAFGPLASRDQEITQQSHVL